jgi:hypothetical protein
MAGKSIINVLINGDTRGLRTALNDGSSNIGSFAAGAAKKLAGVGVAVAGVAAVVGKMAIGAASDLNEVTSKTQVIFGDAAADVLKFAETAGKALGQSQTAALEAASSFGVFGKAAGLTGQDLGSFSTDLAALASDMASFGNTSPEEAAEALGAALRGESEPIRRYGVMLDDATLKAKAMALGIYDGEGALTQQQKILAANAAIFEQTSDAQGDFARTSDGVANQQRILAAQFENVKATLGQQLLPAFGAVLGFITNNVLPGVEKLIAVFDKEGLAGVANLVEQQLPVLKEKLGKFGQAFVDWIGPRIGPALEKLGQYLGKVGEWIITVGLPALGEKLQALGQALIEWIGPRIGPALQALGDFIGKAANWLIDSGLPMLVDKLIVLGQALVDWIAPRIAPALGELGKLLAKILTWIITEAFPKIGAQAVKLAGALLSWIAELLPGAVEGLGRFVAQLVPKFPGLFLKMFQEMDRLGRQLGEHLINAIGNALSGLGSLANDVGRQFANAMRRFINNQIIDRVNSALEFTIGLPFGASFTVNPPDIGHLPMLAKGGVVTAPTLAVIGEAGPEAVVPLSKYRMDSGGNGSTINLTVNAGMGADGTRIGQEIVRELLKYQRQNGALPLKVA